MLLQCGRCSWVPLISALYNIGDGDRIGLQFGLWCGGLSKLILHKASDDHVWFSLPMKVVGPESQIHKGMEPDLPFPKLWSSSSELPSYNQHVLLSVAKK